MLDDSLAVLYNSQMVIFYSICLQVSVCSSNGCCTCQSSRHGQSEYVMLGCHRLFEVVTVGQGGWISIMICCCLMYLLV